MTFVLVVTLIACAGALWLLTLIALRGRAHALAVPLGALGVVLFTWNFAGLLFATSQQRLWDRLDRAASPLTVPLALHVVLWFVGRRRQRGRLLLLSYVLFGALSAVSLSASFAPAAQSFIDLRYWDYVFLALLLPTAAYGWWELLRHARETSDPAEVSRTHRIVLASVLLVALGGSELLIPSLPRLGPLGTVGFALLITPVALRLDVFSSSRRAASLSLLLTAGIVTTLGLLALYPLGASRASVLAVGMGGLAAVLLISGRQLLLARQVRQARLDRFALLGRMSAQLAHDLKNPLAAAKGAVQLLDGEIRAGRSLDGQREFLFLLAEQLERLERVIAQYQRLASVEPRLSTVSLDEIIQQAVSHAQPGLDSKVRITLTLGAAGVVSAADPDLLATALENLLLNANQAMPEGGQLDVTTTQDGSFYTLSVRDTGTGMPARVRAQAFDEFFTTRSSGSGLGLAFVRRVAEAHGGQAGLESKEGEGTRVWIRLPIG